MNIFPDTINYFLRSIIILSSLISFSKTLKNFPIASDSYCRLIIPLVKMGIAILNAWAKWLIDFLLSPIAIQVTTRIPYILSKVLYHDYPVLNVTLYIKKGSFLLKRQNCQNWLAKLLYKN